MIPSSNLGGASRIVSLWRMKKVRIGLFLFSIFRFPSPIAHLRESFSINLLACKNKRYGFFSISLVLFPLIETSWNLPCKQVLRIMKQLRYGKHLSMISFLPIQCMIFSTRFVAQSVEDFHHAILSGKLLYPRKAKRYSFHPYRLMFIFCQRRRHGCRRAFSLPEFVRRIAPPMRIDSHHTSLSGKLLHPMQNKSGRASTIPLDVYLFPTQTARLPHGVFSTRICASNRSANAN